MPGQIRTIKGYALTTALRSPVEVRAVMGYALVPAARPLPVGITGGDAVRSLIAAISTYPFTADTLILGQPRVSEDSLRNTVLSVSPSGEVPYGGKTDLFYTRRQLQDVFVGIGTSFPNPGVATIHQLIPTINQKTGWLLTPQDLFDGPIEGSSVILRPSDESYFFTPGSQTVITLI